MDREISKDIFEVENPVYMDYDEKKKKYLDYVVVATNTEWAEHGNFLGGIVRFYTQTSKEIYDKWGECENSRKYGSCLVKSLKSARGSLGGLSVWLN
jgi:hypothetical protein